MYFTLTIGTPNNVTLFSSISKFTPLSTPALSAPKPNNSLSALFNSTNNAALKKSTASDSGPA